MTVSAIDTFIRAPGNGSTTIFNFPFRIFDGGDLIVRDITDATLDAVTLVLDVDYQVFASATDEGGTVVLTNILPTGHTLDIRSNLPLSQPEDIRNQGRFLPELHEGIVDRLSRQIQDTRRFVDSTLRIPDEEPLQPDFDTVLALANRKGKYLGYFNATTGALELFNSIGATTLSQSVIAGFMNPQTSAEISAGVTPTNLTYPAGNVLRYGADPLGVTDSSAAFGRCFAANQDNFIPAGTYLLNSEVLISRSNIHIRGAGKFLSILKLRGASAGSAALRWSALSQDVLIENLGIDLSTTAGSTYKGLRFSETRPCTIRNMYFRGSESGTIDDTTLIKLDGAGTYTGQMNIVECLFSNSLYGIVQQGAATTINIERNIFINGTAILAGMTAIVLDGTLTDGATIIGNHIERQGIGIFLGGATAQVRQIANYFEANTVWDFQWAAASTVHTSVGDVNPGTPLASYSYDNTHGHVVMGGSYGFFVAAQAISAYRGVIELGLPVAMGYGTDYTPTLAAGAGTLGSTAIAYAYYSRVGGKMTVWFSFTGTLSGSATNILTLGIPGGLTPAKNAQIVCAVTNAASTAFGLAYVTTSGTVINIGLGAGGSGNFTNGAVGAVGQITFRIIS